MLYLIVAVVIIGLLIFVPLLRRITAVLFTIAITVFATAAVVFGIAVLMNDISINERPGLGARINHFLTVNWATTSDKGLGHLTCEEAEKTAGEEKEELPQTAASKAAKSGKRVAAAATPTPSAAPTPEASAEDDVYPELVQRGYPGVPRPALFKLAQQTVNELGGWKIVNADEKKSSLDCIYTTRLLHFNDDVRIEVTPREEIHICSHSRVGKGDFGANIGHIKEFYSTLEPKVDEFYKEEEKKQNEKPPAHH